MLVRNTPRKSNVSADIQDFTRSHDLAASGVSRICNFGLGMSWERTLRPQRTVRIIFGQTIIALPRYLVFGVDTTQFHVPFQPHGNPHRTFASLSPPPHHLILWLIVL